MPEKKNHCNCHFLNFFLFFFPYTPTELCSEEKEGQTQAHNIHDAHAYSKLCRRTQSNVVFIWNLNPKCGSRCTNTHKKKASIIKASVGPGERRSLFQLPSCLTGITVYSSVAVTLLYVLRTTVAWPC